MKRYTSRIWSIFFVTLLFGGVTAVSARSEMVSDAAHAVTAIDEISDGDMADVEWRDAYGNVEAYSDSSITVAGVTFAITAETQIFGDVKVGSEAYVAGAKEENGALTAVFIQAVDENEVEWRDVYGNVGAYSDSSITVDGVIFAITAGTSISGDVKVGSDASVSGSTDENGTLTADFIQAFDDEGYPTNFKDASGNIDAYSSGSITVAGVTFAITGQTQVFGDVKVGGEAYVSGFVDANGVITADFIQVFDEVLPGEELNLEDLGIELEFDDSLLDGIEIEDFGIELEFDDSLVGG